MADDAINNTPAPAPGDATPPVPENPEQGPQDPGTGNKLSDQKGTPNTEKPVDKPNAKDLLNGNVNDKKEPQKESTGNKDSETKDKKDPADEPIKDWSKIKIDFPEGFEVDKNTLDSFGKTAVELGLTEKQAKALVQFQTDANAAFRENLIDAGIKELRKDWGAKAPENQKAVMTLIANIDKEMGGNAFSKALNACGATCFPAVCKGLLMIATAVSEDSMGRGGGMGLSNKPESILEGLEAEWKRARGEK